MKKSILVISVFFYSLIAQPLISEDTSKPEPVSFPQWSFCVAYQFRDVGRDDDKNRPSHEDDPFGGSWHGASLLNDKNIVDVAGLSSLVIKSKILTQSIGKAAEKATTSTTNRNWVSDCYDPHHIFVFYTSEGHPVAAAEVCFECNRVKITPDGCIGANTNSVIENADLKMLAKIAIEAGLSIEPFKSYDAYSKNLEKRSAEAEKEFGHKPGYKNTPASK
jgi:hypothetical protein